MEVQLKERNWYKIGGIPHRVKEVEDGGNIIIERYNLKGEVLSFSMGDSKHISYSSITPMNIQDYLSERKKHISIIEKVLAQSQPSCTSPVQFLDSFEKTMKDISKKGKKRKYFSR